MIRGWATNEVAAQNKIKLELFKEFTRLEGIAENRVLTGNEFRELRTIEKRLDQIWALKKLKQDRDREIETFWRGTEILLISRQLPIRGVGRRE
jgi:hypothetical protein